MMICRNYQLNRFVAYFGLLIITVILGGCGSSYDFYQDDTELKLKTKSYKQEIKVAPGDGGNYRYANSAKPVLRLPNGKERKILHLYGLDPSSGLIGEPSAYQGVKLVVINPQGEVVKIANPVPFVDPITYIPIVGDLYSMTVHLVFLHIPAWAVGGGETKIPADHYFLAMKKSEFSKSKIKKGDKLNIVHENVGVDLKTEYSCNLKDGSTDNYLISFVSDNVGVNTKNYTGKLFISKDNNQAQDLDKIKILEKELKGTKNANGDLVFSGVGIFGFNQKYSLTLSDTSFLMPYQKITLKGLNCAQDLTKTFVQNDYINYKNLNTWDESLDFVKEAKQVAENKKEHDRKFLTAIERKKEEQRQIALAFAAKQAALKRIADFYKTYTVKVDNKSTGNFYANGTTHRFIRYLEGTSAYGCRSRNYNIVVAPKTGAKIYKTIKLQFNLKGFNLNNNYTKNVDANILSGSSKFNISFDCVKEYEVWQGRNSIISNGGLKNNASYSKNSETKLTLNYEVIQVD